MKKAFGFDIDEIVIEPRAGEHTETDEVNEQCAALGGETIGNLRNNFAVMRQHARNLEAQRDQLRAREAELVAALEYQLPGPYGWRSSEEQRRAVIRAALSKVRGA